MFIYVLYKDDDAEDSSSDDDDGEDNVYIPGDKLEEGETLTVNQLYHNFTTLTFKPILTER